MSLPDIYHFNNNNTIGVYRRELCSNSDKKYKDIKRIHQRCKLRIIKKEFSGALKTNYPFSTEFNFAGRQRKAKLKHYHI